MNIPSKTNSAAESPHEGSPFYPPVDEHLIPSQHVKQTFKIQVMQPVQTAGETTKFPVVYVSDGNSAFDMLKGISRILQWPARDVPRFILIGIGYPGDSPLAGTVLRTRDLTFPGYPRFAMKPPSKGVRVPEQGEKDFYGAEDFQKFIADDLIPFIDGKYSTVAGDRTYFGHSAGGGFGLFTLFTRSNLFKRYIISSPGLIFDGDLADARYDNHDFLLQDARRFIASGKSLESTTLYMSVGTEEESESGLEAWHLTSSFYRMAALIKAAAIPGLTFTLEALSGETHFSSWPIAFIHGIRTVLGDGALERP